MTMSKAERMEKRHPHSDATYRVVPRHDRTFGVEVTIPEMNPTTVTSFGTTADAELTVPTSMLVMPYAIGGVGIYNSHRSLFLSTKPSTDPGLNVGGGLRFRFSDVAAFVEARYHRATRSDGIRFVPITVGILL